MNFNSYKFFRKHFSVPPKKKMQWCIIEETTSEGTSLRLGINIIGTQYFIDVARRRFFMECHSSVLNREVYPAHRVARKKDFDYISESGRALTLPKSYIADIYQTAIFDDHLQCPF